MNELENLEKNISRITDNVERQAISLHYLREEITRLDKDMEEDSNWEENLDFKSTISIKKKSTPTEG